MSTLRFTAAKTFLAAALCVGSLPWTSAAVCASDDALLEFARSRHYAEPLNHMKHQETLLRGMLELASGAADPDEAESEDDDSQPDDGAEGSKDKTERTSQLYHEIGNAYFGLGLRLLSAYYFSALVRAEPDNGHNQGDLADSLMELGEPDRALKHYELAARGAPDDAYLRLRLGDWYYVRGDWEPAAIAYRAAGNTGKDEDGVVHSWLMRYLVQVQSGASPTALKEEAATISYRKWPYPLLRYYLGEIDETALLADLRQGDETKEREQMCEALFYLAERHRIQNSSELARRYYAASMDTKVLEFREYALSHWMVRRMNKSNE